MNHCKTLTLILFLSSMLAWTANAQKIDLNLKDVTVKEAMETLKDRSGYSFVYEAGDIDETSERWRRLLRLEHLCQIIDAMIRDLYDAHIRLDGAERKIRRFCSGFCDGIEQRALPYIRKTDNADLQIRTHGYSL